MGGTRVATRGLPFIGRHGNRLYRRYAHCKLDISAIGNQNVDSAAGCGRGKLSIEAEVICDLGC